MFKDSNFQTNAEIVLKGLQMFNDLIVKIDPSVQSIFIIDVRNLSLSLITMGIAIIKRLVLLITVSLQFSFLSAIFFRLVKNILYVRQGH